jgi:hypothetical protein
MKRLMMTAGTVTALLAGSAVAQETTMEADWRGMQGSYELIAQEVSTEFARLGIDRDAGTLTLDELGEVFLVMEAEDRSDQQRTEDIRAILN